MVEIRPLSHVAVVGGGTVASLAAIALARSLPVSRISLVPYAIPGEALADHAVSGGGALQRLHARIGIGDPLLFARAGATPWLATRYRGFGHVGDFLVGHGAAARDPAGGFAAEPSLASLLAAQERWLLPEQEGSGELDVLLRFDLAAYRAGLHALAKQAGVQVTPPAVAAGVPGLRLENGNTLEADLIVDATGSGWVRAGQPHATWRDWAQDAQLRRLCRSSAPAAMRASLSDTVTKVGAGYWMAQPGRHQTSWTACWADAQDDARMQRALESASGTRVSEPIAFRPGRLDMPWQGNVVAIGDAAVRLAPLGSLNLHLAAAQILLLLDLLPRETSSFAECAEFNRRAGLLADDAQDFVRCQQRKEGSALLAQRVDQFSRRGWIPELAEGCIPADTWAQLLIGLGIKPGTLPRLQAMPQEEVQQAARARESTRSRLLSTAHLYRI